MLEKLRRIDMKWLQLVPVLLLLAGAPAGTPGRVASHPAVGDRPSRLLVEPNMGVRAVIRALDQAQQHIFVESYILSNRRIVRGLERAAAQGVNVYVILERRAIGMGTQPEAVSNQLRAAGVSVRWASTRFALTHTKMIVLDGRLAIISTANFSAAGFRRDRDFLIFDRTPAIVRRASALFIDDWDGLRVGGEPPPLVVAPTNARRLLSSLIDSARSSLSIYAEEIGDISIEGRLVIERERKVRVRVLLEAGQSAGAASYLERNGVEVHSLVTPYIHAKLIRADGRLAFVGSENLSTQSLDRNREVGLLVRGPSIPALARIFNEDWARSSAVRTPTLGQFGSRISRGDPLGTRPPWPAEASSLVVHRQGASR